MTRAAVNQAISDILWGLDEVGGQGDCLDEAFIWEAEEGRRPLITFEMLKALREARAQERPTLPGKITAALHDALAIMSGASDVLADYPEHETLTRSLRASCLKAFEALPYYATTGAARNASPQGNSGRNHDGPSPHLVEG